MNILGCLDRPISEKYLLDGTEVESLSYDQLATGRNKKISVVLQKFNLLSRMDVLNNVALPLIYAGATREERMEKAANALERVGLGNRLDHRPNELSGSQQQRVVIAKVLVNDQTIVLVTHEPEIAEFAEHIIVVRDGEIVENRRKEKV